MRTAFTRHDQVLREAIESHGGQLFKHIGDGVCAAFTSPKSAVDAAVAAQRSLELPVRMGLATGEAELRDSDYFGAVLNRVARVMAAGHGGQILLADSTAGLLSGVELLDLGPRRLRDLPTPVGLFQIRAPGLRTDFPALRTADVRPGNLRSPLTSLIGRETEIEQVQSALKIHRLVTLTGVGGVGKTRLALEVSTRLADEFPDGVWFFELATVTDPAAVPDAVAAVLGITQQAAMTVTESVAVGLEGRLRLLVFDNCEHVRDATADLLEAILSRSTTVRILATSRERLEVADEQLCSVPSLDMAAGIDSPAARLFVQRAQRVSSYFSALGVDDEAAVVEICRRLDGIPLAIELAASRMTSMTPVEVRDRLDDRFRLLVGSRRGLSRHQTLRHAVAWSYDHLDEQEKALLERCSVFAGGFDLQSACAMTGSTRSQSVDDHATLDLLDSLVRKSLLVVDRLAGRTRYSMLETIREFRWAADHNDLDDAVTIATSAAFLGFMVIKMEPTAWVEELIESARAADHPQLAFLYVLASNCYMAGRVDDGLRYADLAAEMLGADHTRLPFGLGGWPSGAYTASGHPEWSIELCRAQLARNRDTHTLTRGCLVMALTIRGASEEAEAIVDDLVNAARATRNPAALCYALLAEGFALRDVEPSCALRALRHGLALSQESGNRTSETHTAAVLCRVEPQYGDPLAALDYFRLAVQNHHEAGNTTMISTPLALLAAFFDRMERYEPAATIAGFAFGPVTAASFPEIRAVIEHLGSALGADAYEGLAQAGARMTTAEMANYAYREIDRTRTELERAS